MNFAFDIDGTITAAPAYYAALMTSLRKCGHGVHVLTGTMQPVATDATYSTRDKQLRGYGITSAMYDKLHIVTSPGNVEQKAQYCLDHDIGFVFEDSQLYTEAIRAVGVTVVTHPYSV